MTDEVLGRGAEIEAARAAFDRLDEGPLALLIEGPAGIGKTTLWHAAIAVALDRGARLLTTRAAETEARLAFSGLSDLLGGLDAGVFDEVPAPQRRALDVALLRAEPDDAGADPRAVAAATTTILRRLAGERPLVVAIDDAQWLDSTTADALMFAARRLGDVKVGFIATVRTPVKTPATLLGLGEALPNLRIHRLTLGPLAVGSLYQLFVTRLGRELPRSTIERIAEASGGNPFHALEIARQIVDGGHLDAAAPLPVPESILDAARDRIRRLPPETRGALLRVAALGRPTTALVNPADLAAAEADGLVQIGFDGRIAFSHPLFGAAVYCEATTCDRRVVHASLAAVVTDPEERARHEALASTGPDSAVADRLAEAGRRARARGATAAAAELAELAVRLTPLDDADARLRRELEHAEYLHVAGQPLRAQEVLEDAIVWAEPGELREEARLQLGIVCRQTDQARSIAHCEEALANATTPQLRARAEATLGLLYEAIDIEQAARHSAAAATLFEELGDEWSWADATIGQCWHRLQLGHGPDNATFQRALAVQAGQRRSGARWAIVPFVWALAHDDLDRARAAFGMGLDWARQQGAESELGLLKGVIAQIDLWRGDYEAADAGADEAVELARLGGSPMTLADALRLRASIDGFRGRFARARETLGPGWAELGRPDEGRFTQATHAILGHIAHASGDAAAADEHFTAATDALEATGIHEYIGYRFLGDHVEAVLALGDIDRADAIVATMDRQAATFPRPWTLAVRARARGLVLAARGDLAAAVGALDEAEVLHAGLDTPYELGRTLFAKASVHRRRTEKRLAKEALERALALFESSGAEPWAERARAELARLRFRTTPTELTDTEQRMAELAATGRTNREIAAAMFVSPKTVEARLASAYGKLGIRSRAELGALMAARGTTAPAGDVVLAAIS
ncbi:MAG TPA: AAA family ATPase [Candidatus Limnocylindrales bacterium]|nr:AAA family ATPase [Candidatus Limnocylindrales bacterium]